MNGASRSDCRASTSFRPFQIRFETRRGDVTKHPVVSPQSEYRKRGFQEVVTPNIYNSKLWQTSGHWQHYSENMFSFEVEKETFALKPMNCPGHW